jgi:hypothetical protein
MRENIDDDKKLRVYHGEEVLGIKKLQGIGAAETYLAEEEDNSMEEHLAALIDEKGSDHPMVEEMSEILSKLGGDLGKLPPGHPILMQILNAKNQYEQMIETEEAQAEAIKIKKAKRIDASRKIAEHRYREEEKRALRKDVVKGFNEKIDNTISSVELLAREIEASKEKFEE